MAADLPSGMIAVIFQWAARRATDPKDVRRGKAEPGVDRPSPSEVGMCGVPSSMRVVRQHSLTREGERLIPMVFALPAVVDPPLPRRTERTDFLAVPQVRMLCIFSWVSPRGVCCRFVPGCPPGENAVDFSCVRQGRMLWFFPGCRPREDAVQFILALPWRHAARFFPGPLPN